MRYYFRFKKVRFQLDRLESTVCAHIWPDNGRILWFMDINCTMKGVPSGMQSAHLDAPLPFAVADWRSLANRSWEKTCESDDEEMGGIYVGWHTRIAKLGLQFGSRSGRFFEIRLAGSAVEESIHDWHERFVCEGLIRMSEIVVRFDNETEIDMNTANAMISGIARPGDLGAPTTWQGWVQYPVVATS